MRRRFFNLLTAVSLLLCVATTAFWARSYYVCDLYVYDGFDRKGPPYVMTRVWIDVDFGGVGIVWSRSVCTSAAPDEALRWFEAYVREEPTGWRRLIKPGRGYPVVESRATPAFDHFGLLVSRTPQPGIGGLKHPTVRATVPLWLLTTLFAAPPALWIRRRWRLLKRIRNGGCLVCGYDLRATPERCPECGTITTGQPAGARADTL